MTVSWLSELTKQRRVPVPWPEMMRAALAICLPLSASLAAGKSSLGVLPAMGGLLGILADTGGPYLTRVKRVASASVLGGAVGLTIGAFIHGHGWAAVAGLVVVAGASGVLSSVGDIGSVIGLQLLVYATLGVGPVGALRPTWHIVTGFLAGVAWALILILPGWLLSPHGKEQRNVAAVYHALAVKLSAIGTDGFAAARQAVTTALNTAYDELLTGRSIAAGRNLRTMRLVAALNLSHLMAEASTALAVAGTRPPPLIIDVIERLAESVRDGTPPPVIPPVWDQHPGAVALRDAIAGAARVLSPEWAPARQAESTWAAGKAWRAARVRRRVALAAERVLDGFGRQNRMFTIRLMCCILAGGVISEVAPLQRSYWVPLTVAIVFKPDYGSVIARALQRGLGTVVGAVLGAVLLAAVHGLWLLIPFGVFAALLPFGRSRNYGLLATFLTPLVVILIDLLNPGGWRLAEDRLIDTLIGCGIVLAIGFAPWWTSWYAHLPRQFEVTAQQVADYLDLALAADDVAATGSEPKRAATAVTVPAVTVPAVAVSAVAVPGERSRMRRRTYRALADLRAEFQRTMSEPPSISRRATVWWPALVALEQVMDAATALGLEISTGAPAPPPGEVHALSDALRAAAAAEPASPPAVSDAALAPVTEAVKALLGVLPRQRS